MVVDEYLVRPAHDRERPYPRREPGIKNIWVLLIAFRCGFIWAKTDDVLVALCILWSVPNWNAVAPPQLAADAPVLDALQPPVPLRLGRLGCNVELAGPCALR